MTPEERKPMNALRTRIQAEKTSSHLCAKKEALEVLSLVIHISAPATIVVDPRERGTRIIFTSDFEANDERLRRLGVA